jgi:hypothetical protein
MLRASNHSLSARRNVESLLGNSTGAPSTEREKPRRHALASRADKRPCRSTCCSRRSRTAHRGIITSRGQTEHWGLQCRIRPVC